MINALKIVLVTPFVLIFYALALVVFAVGFPMERLHARTAWFWAWRIENALFPVFEGLANTAERLGEWSGMIIHETEVLIFCLLALVFLLVLND